MILISNDFWHKIKIYNFDPYDVLLSIATNIAVLLMTASVLQGHTHSLGTLLGTLASTGSDHFCLPNCINSSWHRFNKVLEALLSDFGPYCHDSITCCRFVMM